MTASIEFAGPVNRERLHRALIDRGVHPDSVSLFGDISADTAYVLDHSGTEWLVGFYERGVRHSVETFPNEDAACRRFAELVLASGRTSGA